MNQIHVEAAGESPSFDEEDVHVDSSASWGDAVTTPIQDLGGPPHRILVVADALISSGNLVDTAEDGVAGWLALDVNDYNCSARTTTCQRFRALSWSRRVRSARMDLPVVLVSGAIPTEEIRRNPSPQLAATLLKPFTIVELLDTVEKALNADSRRNRRPVSVPLLAADAHRIWPRHNEQPTHKPNNIAPGAAGEEFERRAIVRAAIAPPS